MIGTGLYRLYCWFVSAAWIWVGVFPDQCGEVADDRRVLGGGDPGQGDLLRHLVADQGIAVAIEDQAPGRRHGHRADLVGHDRLGGGRGLEDLECPEAQSEQGEQSDHDDGHDAQTAGRDGPPSCPGRPAPPPSRSGSAASGAGGSWPWSAWCPRTSRRSASDRRGGATSGSRGTSIPTGRLERYAPDGTADRPAPAAHRAAPTPASDMGMPSVDARAMPHDISRTAGMASTALVTDTTTTMRASATCSIWGWPRTEPRAP